MLRLSFRFVTVCALLFMTAGLLSTSALSQEQTKPELKFRFTPEKLQANVGDKLDLKVELIDKDGAVQSTQFFVFARGRDARRSVEVNPRRSDSTGVLNAIVTAHRPGSFRLMAISATSPEERVTGMTMIDIAYPELEKITFINPKTKVYANTHGEYALKVTDVAGLVRDEVKVALTSSNPDVVSINDYGHFRAHKAGSTTIAATAEGVETRLQVEVADNPVASLELHSEMTEAPVMCSTFKPLPATLWGKSWPMRQSITPSTASLLMKKSQKSQVKSSKMVVSLPTHLAFTRSLRAPVRKKMR